jgi:hypothetical protein
MRVIGELPVRVITGPVVRAKIPVSLILTFILIASEVPILIGKFVTIPVKRKIEVS